MAGVQASGSRGPLVPSGGSARSSGGIDLSTLDLQCQQFLVDGLASTTHSSYASGQRRFVEFCMQLRKVVTYLAQSGWPSTIKVYLSAIRALHIEHGFPYPLINCLRLQRVLYGIKRSLGDSGSTCHPDTDSTLFISFNSLDIDIPDHYMFWASCNLAYFGFLRSLEFTVPNLASFSKDVHFSLADISIDSHKSPTSLRLHLKNRPLS